MPAKKIGQRFSDEIIQELVKLEWWNLPEKVIKENLSLFRDDVTADNIKRIIEKLSIDNKS